MLLERGYLHTVPDLHTVPAHGNVSNTDPHFVNSPEIVKGEVDPGQSDGWLYQYLQHGGQEVLPVSQHVVVHPQCPGA